MVYCLQSSQTAFQEQHINGPDLGDEDLLFINVQEDMSDGIDGMQVSIRSFEEPMLLLYIGHSIYL